MNVKLQFNILIHISYTLIQKLLYVLYLEVIFSSISANVATLYYKVCVLYYSRRGNGGNWRRGCGQLPVEVLGTVDPKVNNGHYVYPTYW